MTPEQQVISRPLAEALKVAGVPQGQSHYVWWRNYLDHGYILDRRDDAVLVGHTYDAFTLAELIAYLELKGYTRFSIECLEAGGYFVQTGGKRQHVLGSEGATVQEAAGQLVQHIVEDGTCDRR
jgi:hypothetical protein